MGSTRGEVMCERRSEKTGERLSERSGEERVSGERRCEGRVRAGEGAG